MVRQETRLNNFERVIQTDQGVDPLSGLPFKMTRGSTVYKDYRDKLATVLARAKSDGWCGLTLDRCLHLIAEASGRTPPERQGVKIAHDFYHLRRGSYCVAQVLSRQAQKDRRSDGLKGGVQTAPIG
jgi:hypothetical protein